MTRTTGRLLGLVVLVVAAVAVGAILVQGRPSGPREIPGETSSTVGVIVAVDGEALGEVRGFTLRTTDGGDLVEFSLEALQNATEFPPAHLVEHQATAAPVVVYYRTADGTNFAIRVDDAET
jgi:hypothetical protein